MLRYLPMVKQIVATIFQVYYSLDIHNKRNRNTHFIKLHQEINPNYDLIIRGIQSQYLNIHTKYPINST